MPSKPDVPFTCDISAATPPDDMEAFTNDPALISAMPPPAFKTPAPESVKCGRLKMLPVTVRLGRLNMLASVNAPSDQNISPVGCMGCIVPPKVLNTANFLNAPEAN